MMGFELETFKKSCQKLKYSKYFNLKAFKKIEEKIGF